MTPYYSEETVYSKSDLELENEDGISIIFYLQKIYPGIKLYILTYRDTYFITFYCFMSHNSLFLFFSCVMTFLVLDEWQNFMERINCKRESEVWGNEENVLQLRHWASQRGQTLSRTGRSLIVIFLLPGRA